DEGASSTLTLDNAAGAVFGRIFNRDMQSTAAAVRIGFDSGESLKIVQTGGRRLIQRYWGRYVALVQDGATGEAWILRDPSGGMPCLLASYEGVNLVFADMEDCLQLGLLHFSVSWGYIRNLLAYPGLQVRETALEEVSEIQLGERIRFSGDSIQRALEWDPLGIAKAEPIEDPRQAVAELRSTTRTCVHAWASCYSGIVHNLSGGLDSSIVLSCLRDAPSHPGITCLHYFGTGPAEDERQYARLMANHANAELLEHPLDIREVRLDRLLELRRSPRPWYYLYELEHGRLEAELASERNANGLFSGGGGDGVFFQAHADLAVTDYLFDHGMGADLMRVAVDAARISRKSVWPLLYKAVCARLFPPRWDPIAVTGRPAGTLVSEDVLKSARGDRNLLHPWFTPAAIRGVPPGILWHALTVAVPPAYYNSFSDCPCPERTLPLLSQPLVELCLRIPTYVLIDSGMDRAIARRAFASDLPPQIVQRRNKGRIDQHVRNILDANLDFVRSILLNGRLVNEGLLDRKSLELYLARDRSPADFQYAEILQVHLCIEAWLSRWLDDPRTRPRPI
ncbi:MAG: asparagine synthase-related protein, partial [Steroidobacteraceae bacterium]